MQKIMNREEGFTGLEAAIVLIAFVVVAAVFSYVVLGAGFFTTQKAQEVVYTSVDMSSSSMEIIGDVYGIGVDNNITTIRFTVGLSAGGSAVDFSTTQMVFATSEIVEILEPVENLTGSAVTTGHWNITDGASPTDVLLEANDKFTILAMPTTPLGVNQKFNLEVRPSVGSPLGLKRTTPPKIDAVNLLY